MITKHDFIDMCTSFNDNVANYTLFSEKPWFGATQAVWADDTNERAIQLIYNGDTILGLQIKPFLQFESNRRLLMNQYRMPIDDEWFVFWGGTNEFDNYHYPYKLSAMLTI